MAFNLATLFVTLKAKDEQLKADIERVRSTITPMGLAIGTAAGGLLSSAIGGALSSLTGFVSRGIAGATDLAETISKLNAVFGDSAAPIIAYADDMAKSFGLPKQAMLDAASSFGLVGKAAGQTQAQASDLAVTMAKLAADASSFYNVPMDTALEKIRAGLVGESEPLRAFGVLLNEEAVNAQALAMGLAKSKAEIDDQAKVAARAALIQKGLGDATGDLERTADSTANRWRQFTGTIENTAVAIGTSLSPAISGILALAVEMEGNVVAAVEASKASFESFAKSIADAVGTVGLAWRSLPDLIEIVQIRFQEMTRNLVAGLATVPENLAIVGNWLSNNFVNMIRDAFNAATAVLTNFGENIYRLGDAIRDWMANPTGGFKVDFKPLLEGFEVVTEALPEMVRPAWISLQEEMNAVTGRMADREATRLAEMAAKVKDAAHPAAKAIGDMTAKLKEFKAEQSGLVDFRSKLISLAYSEDAGSAGASAGASPALKKSERHAAMVAMNKQQRRTQVQAKRLAARAGRGATSKQRSGADAFAKAALAGLSGQSEKLNALAKQGGSDTAKKQLAVAERAEKHAARMVDLLEGGIAARFA